MNPDHARFADWDSAYVLGALSPAERRDYEEHLETCETCRRSVAELAPMPGLLARLSPERAAALLDDPEAASAPAPRPRPPRGGAPGGPAPTAPVVRARGGSPRGRGGRARVRRDRGAARDHRGRPTRRSVAFESVVDVPLTATATLTPAGWGTRIELDCRYAEDAASDAPAEGWPYALVVVDRDGERSEVSSWRASPGSDGAPLRRHRARPRRDRVARDPGAGQRRRAHARRHRLTARLNRRGAARHIDGVRRRGQRGLAGSAGRGAA